MRMYAVIDTLEEGLFWSFRDDGMGFTLDESCLLPTREMAEEFIAEECGQWEGVAEVTIHRLVDGAMEYSVKPLTPVRKEDADEQ